jgi:hypothetical protein
MPGRRSVRGSFEPRSEEAGGRSADDSVAPASQHPDAVRAVGADPLCQANTVSAVYAVRMSEVAVAEGYRPTFGQSPFAIARGDQFERSLFYRGAAAILAALAEKEVLPTGAGGFLDLRLRMNGGTRLNALDKAIDETKTLLRRIAEAKTRRQLAALPAVVAAPTVRIPRGVMLPEANLIIDALAIRTDGPRPLLIVGEVKAYPDRGGYTDPQELAAARAQAGIYLHALELLVAELAVKDSVDLSSTGFLVLSKPGSNRPSVRAGEDLRYQAERARRGFDLLERAAQALPPFDFLPTDHLLTGDDLIRAVKEADTTYSEACLSFCDRAPKCFAESLEAGDPIVLGEDAWRFVGGISLHRVMELLDGGPPATSAEQDLVRRIEESDEATAR